MFRALLSYSLAVLDRRRTGANPSPPCRSARSGPAIRSIGTGPQNGRQALILLA